MNLKVELMLQKDDLDDLKDQIAKQDKRGLKQMEQEGGEAFARAAEYYNDFYKYLE